MKVSTRIKKYGSPHVCKNDDIIMQMIVFMVDCKKTGLETHSLSLADEYHRHLTRDEKCTLLSQECPVNNGKEIILHYTSTTYKDWCNS